ncbi:conserved hypothetical protein [Vibrio phage 193E37-1]|nr:conserved hypothetical protein [Vibrio phage 193E37-1]
MEYLFIGMSLSLGISILGTFGLVIGVSWYIYCEIQKDNKSTQTKYCKWGIKDGVYTTNCGEDFYDASESGNPVTDWLNHCPYCGCKVRVEKYEQ